MTSSLKNTTVNDTGYLILPVGSTSQRSPATFTSNGTWTCPVGVTSVEVLAVGGGGGGGFNGGGGGGAGGLTYNSSLSVTPGTVYTVGVGSGGLGSSASVSVGYNGTGSAVASGTELITNGSNFTATTGWTATTATLSVPSTGIFQIIPNASVNGTASQSITTVNGTSYLLTITVLLDPGKFLRALVGTTQLGIDVDNKLFTAFVQSGATGTGTYSTVFTAVGTTTWINLQVGGGTSQPTQITSISVKPTVLLAQGGGGGNSRSFAGTMAAGGSGGGGGGSQAASSQAAGTGIIGQGNNGGIGTAADAGTSAAGGGGGGAGAVGTAAASLTGGAGGAGLSYSISGIPTYYAGGGGGGCTSPTAGTPGVGGNGGGGRGGAGTSTVLSYGGQPGTINTGGGGGGAGGGTQGGQGGSGIVIINWASSTNAGSIRVNTTTKAIESNTGSRNQPSLGATGWQGTGQALQNLQASGLVTNGLACLLDAGNVSSYPGTGSIWYDISGNNRHFYINSSVATWTSAGNGSYFTTSPSLGNASRDVAGFIGPASDTWGFDQEHFFEFVLNNVATSTNQLFMFSPNGKNQDTVGAQNLLQSHWLYGNGNTYYDVYGCCSGNQRVYVNNNTFGTQGVIQHVSYRTRVTEYPNRAVFHNSSTVIDSGQNPTDTAFWDKQDPAVFCLGTSLKIYYVAIYNRALTDTERAANYAVLQSRYGIS